MIAIFINFWKWEVDISIGKKSLTTHFKVFVSKIIQFSIRKSVSRYKSHFEEFSGGELLEIRLLNNQLVDTFGRKSTALHQMYQLLESS